jgi:hypothetical protein
MWSGSFSKIGSVSGLVGGFLYFVILLPILIIYLFKSEISLFLLLVVMARLWQRLWQQRQYKRDEVFNAVSMLPGIGMIGWWMVRTPYVWWPPLCGYILMCCGSMLYHIDAAINGVERMLFLRCDLICQNIACLTGVLYSPYSTNAIVISTIINMAYISCVFANLYDPREVNLAKFGNGMNIFLMLTIDQLLIIEFCGSACIFLYYFIVRTNDYSHAIWHLTIHVIFYRYIDLMIQWQYSQGLVELRHSTI